MSSQSAQASMQAQVVSALSAHIVKIPSDAYTHIGEPRMQQQVRTERSVQCRAKMIMLLFATQPSITLHHVWHDPDVPTDVKRTAGATIDNVTPSEAAKLLHEAMLRALGTVERALLPTFWADYEPMGGWKTAADALACELKSETRYRFAISFDIVHAAEHAPRPSVPLVLGEPRVPSSAAYASAKTTETPTAAPSTVAQSVQQPNVAAPSANLSGWVKMPATCSDDCTCCSVQEKLQAKACSEFRAKLVHLLEKPIKAVLVNVLDQAPADAAQMGQEITITLPVKENQDVGALCVAAQVRALLALVEEKRIWSLSVKDGLVTYEVTFSYATPTDKRESLKQLVARDLRERTLDKALVHELKVLCKAATLSGTPLCNYVYDGSVDPPYGATTGYTESSRCVFKKDIFRETCSEALVSQGKVEMPVIMSKLAKIVFADAFAKNARRIYVMSVDHGNELLSVQARFG